MSQKKFRIATLGCRTNQYESEAYRKQLELLGYSAANAGESADLCIVNTCTVTHAADRDSMATVRRLALHNPDSKLVVTGCSAQARPADFKALAGVSEVVPNSQKEELLATLFPDQELPEFAIDQFEGHTRAFVKVQDGCNSYCTYCIIPYVRGRSRSRPLEEIIAEVTNLVSSGYREVVLTGINIGDYDGGDGKTRLAHLVRAVDLVPGLKRLRLSSIDPDEVDEELTQALLEGQNTCPSLHLVLQSGSNYILKRMNRKYTRQIFYQTVERLLKLEPDFTFTTDLIVCFPGESETDFEETLSVVEQVKFAKVHFFPYSPRARTRAALYEGRLPPEVYKERKARLLRHAEEVAYRLRERFIGRTMDVLIEGRIDEQGRTMGHTANFLNVWIENCAYPPHAMVNVELLANSAKGLIGKII